jgi:hypothetical protein
MKLRNLLLVVFFFIGFTTNIYAGKHPETNFGIYGIQHFSTIAQYQQIYLGQVVQYIPDRAGGNYMDIKYFLNAGGKFNTDYVVSKIKGNDKRMTWFLNEKGTKKKIKMVINNQEEYYSYGKKHFYCITNSYSIPLLLSDKLNSDKSNYIGKNYPKNSDGQTKFEITNIIIQPQDDTSYEDLKYPKVCFLLKDKTDGNTIYFDAANISDLNNLGKVFTNPKFKCQYTVINIFKKMNYDDTRHKVFQKYYIIKNSIDGTTKTVKVDDAQLEAFKSDDSGKFNASLTKVEKPTNSAIRYGKTTNITEKDITKYSYKDNFIDILIFASDSKLNFILKNISDNTLKVVWNEAVFVDVDGSTSKIMHKGTKYVQKENDQPASTIIKGAKLEDLAVPTNKVYYSELLKDWVNTSLYSNADPKLEGQTIKLMLPIQVKDVVNEYIFEFTLTYVYDHPEYLVN